MMMDTQQIKLKQENSTDPIQVQHELEWCRQILGKSPSQVQFTDGAVFIQVRLLSFIHQADFAITAK